MAGMGRPWRGLAGWYGMGPAVCLFRAGMDTDVVSLRASDSAIKGTLFAHADFILTGVVMTLLGPMLPVFERRWSVDDAQAGYLFVAQFVTSMVGMLCSGPLVKRMGYRRTMILGLLLMTVGVLMLARGGWVLGLASVSVFGVGFGATTPAVNLFIADANPGKRASALNLVNASWGIGAMGCPLLVAAAQRVHRPSLFFYGLAAGLLALAALLLPVRFEADAKRHHEEDPAGERGSWWQGGLLPLIVLVFFVYVGTENSVGGWVAAYARRISPGSVSFWAMVPSFFWGALLAGRILAPLALRHVRETSVACAGLVLAVLGVTVLLSANGMTVVVLGACVTGLGLSSIFPINVSLLPHWFGEALPQLSGTIFSAGNLGGAVLPWVVGEFSSRFGSLRVGFFVPLVSALFLLSFYLVQASARRRVPEAA
jgi:MFS transporter, FHS family, glucose/mannose:H+ symporter